MVVLNFCRSVYIIVMWIPFNKTSVRIVKSIIILWTPSHETFV
jgi:hypothetical protein